MLLAERDGAVAKARGEHRRREWGKARETGRRRAAGEIDMCRKRVFVTRMGNVRGSLRAGRKREHRWWESFIATAGFGGRGIMLDRLCRIQFEVEGKAV